MQTRTAQSSVETWSFGLYHRWQRRMPSDAYDKIRLPSQSQLPQHCSMCSPPSHTQAALVRSISAKTCSSFESILRPVVMLLSLIASCNSSTAGGVWVSPDANFNCTLPIQEILDAPDWSPDLSLPLSLSDAVDVARQRLNKITKDTKNWFLYDITLSERMPHAPFKWNYDITFCRVASRLDQSRGCTLDGYVQLEVTMNRRVGTFSKASPPRHLWLRDGSCYSLAYQQKWQFNITDTDVRSTSLSRTVILDGPDWTLMKPLPLDIDHASRLAQDEVAKLVKDASEWRIYSISLQVLPGTSTKWFYKFYITRPIKEHPESCDGEIVIQISLDGRIGLPH